MQKIIDLHVHSSYSDGTLSPYELVKLAFQRNVCALALTDHDTVQGVKEASEAALEYGIELIPGVELSTSYREKDIHILGLGIDINNVHVQAELLRFQKSRDIRNHKMIEKLQTAGIDITYEKMLLRFSDCIWTRAHFARFLMERNYVSHIRDAFPKYIGDKAPCYVPRELVTPLHAIDLIHEGNGYAVLAHPLIYKLDTNELDELVKELKTAGLDGLEVIYSLNQSGDEAAMKRLMVKYDLKLSGGSDFHGQNKPNIQLGTGKGNVNMPYEVWAELQN